MAEYICFFHPRVKGQRPEDRCSVCEKNFGFPQENLPKTLGEYDLEGLAGRGFYSVAIIGRHRRTGILAVFKITPESVYLPPDPEDITSGGYGDRRNFEAECRLHLELSDLPHIARIQDWGRSELDFNGTMIPCCWSMMERIDGLSVDDASELADPLSPLSIAQIVSDLLDLEVSLSDRGVFHNDLHGGNATIVTLPAGRSRPRAIDERLEVKVFDLGSAARGDLSTPSRFNDIERITEITFRLLDAWEQRNVSATATDLRMAAQLRRVAQFYTREEIASRKPRPAEMVAAIESAYEFAIHPEQTPPAALRALDAYYNAQILPPEFTRGLIHDPNGEWSQQLTGPGPQLVVGMRGCGKTMLLRSLEWRAQAVSDLDESTAEVVRRLNEMDYVGFFVSCAYLLGAPRTRVGPGAAQGLYLAYAREAIRSATVCQARGLGEVDMRALDEFVRRVAVAVPSFQSRTSPPTLLSVERDLSATIQADRSVLGGGDFSALEAFAQLAEAVTSLVDVWAKRTVLYLLDDVSKRYVSEEDLDDLLTQFCLRHESFGFKISTESQTPYLVSPSGQPAIEGRDYQIFDLGEAVLERLSTEGTVFLENILIRRLRALHISDPMRPRELLGSKSTRKIATELKSSQVGSTGRRGQYSGLRALSAICVGDIGDVIQIYQKMVRKHGHSKTIAAAQQHRVLEEESSSRLLALVPLEAERSYYYLHAAAFAQASHRELVADREPHTDGSPREFGDLLAEISSSDRDMLRKILDLVDNGLYAIVGFRQRTKTVGAPPFFQFRLRFRKLLGLKFGMPLSNRDRFELSGDRVAAWLSSPDSQHLSPEPANDSDWVREWIQEEDRDDDEAAELEPLIEPATLFSLDDGVVDSDDPASMPLTTGMSAAIDSIPLARDSIDWSRATLVVAAGFEDRASGSLDRVTKVSGGVDHLVLLTYPSTDSEHPMVSASVRVANTVTALPIDPDRDPTSLAESIIEAARGPLVVDVSAMTKSLIYAIVRSGLSANNELFVVHTSAAQYEPAPASLKPVLEDLRQGEYARGLRALDALTPGEGRSFMPILIGDQPVEGSSRALFVTFITLKHARVDALLKASTSDRVVGIRSVHPDGEKSVQTRVTDRIGQYLIESRNGEIRQVPSMDAQGTFETLMEYYTQYVLGNPYQLEIALTGTKMQTVGAAMFGSVAKPSLVYYSVSQGRDQLHYTHGVGPSRLYQVRRFEVRR